MAMLVLLLKGPFGTFGTFGVFGTFGPFGVFGPFGPFGVFGVFGPFGALRSIIYAKPPQHILYMLSLRRIYACHVTKRNNFPSLIYCSCNIAIAS